MTGDNNPRFFYGYIIVLVAFFIMVIMIGALYSFGVFFKPVSEEFGWTRAATSGAYSICLLVLGSTSIAMGRLTDKFGPRIVLTICGLFLASGFILMSQISAIWQLYLFYGVLVGIGMSGSFVPTVSTVARWFVKRRGLMTGIATSGIGIGTLTMPLIANWLISSYGWRASYIVFGTIILVFIILVAQFLRRDPSQIGLMPYFEGEAEQENLNLEIESFSFQRAIRTKQFWIVGIMFICFGVCLQSVFVHIVPHATDIEIPAASAVNILAVIGGGSVVGRIILASAGDRIGNKRTLIICFGMVLVSLLSLLAASESWMFYAIATIFGFSYGGLAAILSPILAEMFGLRSLGVILGVVVFSWTIGEASGTVLTGWIFDFTGSYQLAFFILAAFSIVAIILALFLKPIASGQIDNENNFLKH